MQTPILYGDYFYNCRDNDVLACFEAKTSRMVFQARLGSGFGGFTVPRDLGGKIYYVSEVRMVVIKAGVPELKILSKNPLGEICLSTQQSPEGELFFRTRAQLIAISSDTLIRPASSLNLEEPFILPCIWANSNEFSRLTEMDGDRWVAGMRGVPFAFFTMGKS